MAAVLQPLKPGRRFSEPKPHVSELCQKCIELGHNCKNYVPPQTDESIDIPDDQSIISEASTASSSSFTEDQQLSDGDLTPVGSDDEAVFLESNLKSLKI